MELERAETNNKSYYAVIPADVLYDDDLTSNEKLLYGIISNLCNAQGYCWASNFYLSSLMNCSERAIQNWILNLVNKEYLARETVDEQRKLYITGGRTYIRGGVNVDSWGDERSFTHNNIKEYTNINIKKEKEIYKEKKESFIPPTLDEIASYCKERKNNVDAKKFFDYYSVSNWKDREGKKVKNWKQKIITWENKQQPVKEDVVYDKNEMKAETQDIAEIRRKMFDEN